MGRWIGWLPARWAVVLGAGLIALALGQTGYRIGAAGSEHADSPREKPKESSQNSPSTTKTKREALRYGGKNFGQWRVELETELKPEIRVDGLTAMAAFGANGYGAEAARVIANLMRAYEPDFGGDEYNGSPKDRKVAKAAYEAISHIGGPAMPTMWENLFGDNVHIRHFAHQCLSSCKDWHPPVPDLLKAAKDKDALVRETALRVLENVKNKPKKCQSVLLECLKDKEESIRYFALCRLEEMHLEAKEVMPALRLAISDSDLGVRIHGLGMAYDYGEKAQPVVPALLELLNEPKPDQQFIQLMNTLSAIGSGAKDALPRLRTLRKQPFAEISFYFVNETVNCGKLIDETIKKIEGK